MKIRGSTSVADTTRKHLDKNVKFEESQVKSWITNRDCLIQGGGRNIRLKRNSKKTARMSKSIATESHTPAIPIPR